MGFYRQEYWSGLLCPPPRDPSDPGIKLKLPALQADSLSSKPYTKIEMLIFRPDKYNQNKVSVTLLV